MQMIFDPRQLMHAPAEYFREGMLIPHPEQPQRAALIRDRLLGEGHELISPGDHGLGPVEAIHDPEYVAFFKTAWQEWLEIAPDGRTAIPNYFPTRQANRLPKGVFGQLGYYSTGTSCPITAGTWEAIYWSAQTAIEGAERVMAGQRAIYSLCRPPGHHAYRDASNGFCFFNNSSIAAHHLRGKFGKVAIIDIDTHAGQGTQEIMYDRRDVFSSSIHRDPSAYVPFFAGYADETGEGEGQGCHLNICLDGGATDEVILQGIGRMIAAAQAFGAEALVVALGVDMAGDDPLSEVDLSGDGFARAAGMLMAMDLPTLIVQEGGYLGPSLAENVSRFINGAEAALAGA
ncbi:histone deacetylase family protein [Rhodobacteraceae bacterium NNCM2]|nr:histone deacetylase family protein [Coraliihabitans acroporae]